MALVIAAGFMVFHSSLHNDVPTVAAQLSPASAKTTVVNNVTIVPDSISLGSTVHAAGRVTVGTKPLANAAVALHMGDINVANTQTDQNGRYAFSVPVGANYFPAAFSNGAIVYTVVEPQNSSFVGTPSATTSVPVNLTPLYAIIALITAALVTACYLYVRRLREKGSAVVGDARPSRRAAAPVVASGKTAEASPPAFVFAPASEGATSSVGTTTEEPAPLRAMGNEKYCQNCGAKNPPYVAFCRDCSNPFIAPPAPVTESEPARSAEDAGDATPLKQAREQLEQGNHRQDQTDWAVEIDGLVKSYGSIRAVDHISFSIPFGVIFAFLGPNGAGKTTTVEMLECMQKPSAGAAYVLGLDITKDQKEIKKRIGVVPQEFNTFDRLTVRENLKYYATTYEKSRDIDELIVSVDLADQANTQYRNLSGGLKQRVGVAIALVNDPQVVFLDEPTEGLDPNARRRVWEIITKLRDEGKTVFLTTHYMEEAETLADIVAIILNGKIKAMGTTANLINNHGLRTKIVIHGGGTKAFEALGTKWKGTEVNNGNVIVPVCDKKDLVRIAELLNQHRVAFDDLEMTKPSLEDVFLELTRAHEEATS